jgi:hypothetical protein
MTINRRKVVVLVLAALLTTGAVLAGTNAPGVVDDAHAAKAGGVV